MLNPTEIKSLLGWYTALGIDEIYTAESRDFRADMKAAEPVALTTASPTAALTSFNPAPPRPQATSASLTEAIATARTLADNAKTLEELKAAVNAFDGCDLKKMAKNTVFADGTPNAPVMLIGEAPGADEDRQGIPFCGVSGQLQDEMLAAIGLSRTENLYISNTLFWRPPGNRTPTAEEIAICQPLVEKHIALCNPKLLILSGATAMKAMLQLQLGISKTIGNTYQYSNPYLDRPILARVIYHPSFLLRQPLQKREAWADLLEIKSLINSL